MISISAIKNLFVALSLLQIYFLIKVNACKEVNETINVNLPNTTFIEIR